MRKVHVIGLILTFVVALPFTVVALIGAAYIIENMREISTAILTFNQTTSAVGKGWALEIAQRWPEVAGMVIGMIVILTILIFANNIKQVKDPESS
jgi:hypothetical protein